MFHDRTEDLAFAFHDRTEDLAFMFHDQIRDVAWRASLSGCPLGGHSAGETMRLVTDGGESASSRFPLFEQIAVANK